MWNTSSLFRVKSQNASNAPFLCVNVSAFPKPFLNYRISNIRHHIHIPFLFIRTVIFFLLVSFRPNMSNKYKPSGTMSHIFQVKIRFQQANTFASKNICLCATEIRARERGKKKSRMKWKIKLTLAQIFHLELIMRKELVFGKHFFFFYIPRISTLWNLHDSWEKITFFQKIHWI